MADDENEFDFARLVIGCGFAIAAIAVGAALFLEPDSKGPPKKPAEPERAEQISQPEEELTTLLPSCQPNQRISCDEDFFQKVWLKLEADNGMVTKVDTKSIRHAVNGAAQVVVYTYIPNTMFDPARLRTLHFDCKGQYMDISGGPAPVLDAPPYSVVGRVGQIACAGARDRRMEYADRDDGSGRTPKEYCTGLSLDGCEFVKAIIRSGRKPDYCKPGFGAIGSPQNQGLSLEQVRVCSLMIGDFSKLSTE